MKVLVTHMPPSEGGGGSRSEGGGASPETHLEWIAEDGSMREGTGAGKLVAQIVKSVAKEASGTQVYSLYCCKSTNTDARVSSAAAQY